METANAGGDPAAVWKREAARTAAAAVPDGAIVGLGSGSTAAMMLEELAARVRQGLRVTGVASSRRTREQAASLGIPLLGLDDAPQLDLSIDGADEVVRPSLALVKGHGGALLYEKLVAASSRWRIIIVDDSKLVDTLGTRAELPVEVVPFGWIHTARRLTALGLQPQRRMVPGVGGGEAPFVSDGGHYVLDCATGPIADPAGLARAVREQVGVVDHGLFVDMTERVIAAGPTGVRVFDRQ